MAVSKNKKIEVLASIENELKVATSVAFTTNSKLTVEDITRLRRELLAVNAQFTLVKKTLIRLAFKNVYWVELSEELLPGQVAMLISSWDKIAWIAIVNKYVGEFKKDEKIKFVGSYFDWQVLDATATVKIANLPSREVLLAKLLGSMKSPISALARFFDSAKKDVEGKWVTKVADLVSFVAKKEEVKNEEKAVEAPKEEVVVETKEEVKTEEVATEVKEEVAQAE